MSFCAEPKWREKETYEERGNHQQRDTSKERTTTSQPEAIKEWLSEQREGRGKGRSEEVVSCENGRLVVRVGYREVGQCTLE